MTQSTTAAIEVRSGVVPVIPLRNMVVFPGMVAPIELGRKSSLLALDEATRREVPVALLAQRSFDIDQPSSSDLYKVGTLSDVLRVVVSPNGTPMVVVRGRQRFRVEKVLTEEPSLSIEVQELESVRTEGPEFEARILNLKQLWFRLLSALPQRVPELASVIEGVDDPGMVVDLIASALEISLSRKQSILETLDIEERSLLVAEKLRRQTEVLELSKEIDSETKSEMDKTQRDFYLRQQMKTIQKQLGEDGPLAAEVVELRGKLEKAQMPEEVEGEARRELSRLERTPEASLESSMIRTYLEWLIDLPWSRRTEERINLDEARRVLDADHHDLEPVKRRILEFLAVRKLKPQGRSPILCFVGPPGTGKTSVGRSIAAATNRKFVRQSLGGVHDEADIRGHRRTYVGALPGRILQGLRKVGSKNPVFMLDEIDKLSASYHGDPSAALLEVLDPEQNDTFEDHYLGLPFDLSEVMFITTANVLDAIPGPLRDRMEVMDLPGYPEEDKLEIARRFQLGRQIEACGLDEALLTFSDDAVKEIIRSYTRESGVRQLEREIGAVCRSVATRVARGDKGGIRVDAGYVQKVLGPPKYQSEVALRTSQPGVATGLAWTPFGGDILFVESTAMPGRGDLLLTGKLGDVMQESARAALSLIRSRSEELGVKSQKLGKSDLHIHVPAGAIPKDGPSAGVAIFTSLVSLLTGKCVRNDVAMTGEISLRGLVLPVGGIKEKVLAARRADISTVLLPKRNERDLEEVPEGLLAELEIILVSRVEEVLEHTLIGCE